MRIMDRGSRWSPNVSPSDPEDLPKYLFNELSKLSQVLYQVDRLHLDRQYKTPEKPRDGDFALFDKDVVGTKSGIYYYKHYDDPTMHVDAGQWWFLTAEDPS
jgi:hypothetical protein